MAEVDVIMLLAAALFAGFVDAVAGGGGLIQVPALLVALPSEAPATGPGGIAIPVARRGRIGSQPVAEAGTERLSYDGMVTMIRNLTDRGYSYCEVYGVDVAKAIGTTAEGAKMRAVFNERKDAWAP